MSFDIRPAGDVSLQQLEALYRSHPHPPLGYYPDLAREDVVRYASRAAHGLLAREDVQVYALAGNAGTTRGAEGPAGWVAYQALGWDSAQLGVAAGRIAWLELDRRRFADAAEQSRAARALVDAALEPARREGVQHVSARVHAADMAFAQALEGAGFALVDGLLRFGLDRDGASLPTWDVPGLVLRESREQDLERLSELARRGFVYDRFHNDPRIPTAAADGLHAEWAANAVRGATGCGVLVAELEGEVAGFFILAEDALARELLGTGVGTLVLITVDPKYRRRGVAKALSLGSVEWLGARGNRYCEVGTQIANIPASSVYLGAGFRLIDTSLSLRWWRPAD